MNNKLSFELLFTNFGKFVIDKEVQSGEFVTEEQTEAYFSSSLDKFVVGIYQAILKRAIKIISQLQHFTEKSMN